MLRLETETGWWLVTHPDHARLAGAFAERWGNDRFLPPEPRASVLKGIARHDDGWLARDAKPQITRQGKPSAFSTELVGKYSAFEEIDLADYLAVRDRAVRLIAVGRSLRRDAHLHAHLQLAERSRRPIDDCCRGSAAARSLPGAAENRCSNPLRGQIAADPRFTPEQDQRSCDSRSFPPVAGHGQSFAAHVRGFPRAGASAASVCRCGMASMRAFRCAAPLRATSCSIPTRLAEPSLTFHFPARHVEGKTFAAAADLQRAFEAAPIENLSVR